jgi:prenyltransferase/squalene oxidase-like repeat protein
MSWQLVSFLILAGVLLAGFAWYEHSRPPAQVVALVAALAALAIAGRIAFAAFPNAKPTTDIVIFGGYALGPAAGFAIGAFSALISNFWFGQGVWTPWQMAAWGLCGIIGAALARINREVGRWTLAAVCGLSALAFGTIMNFSTMVSYGAGDTSGKFSWAYFWILEGRAIPFEASHVIFSVVLALAAGPAMIRMLIRFRERFEWRRAQGATIPRPGGAPGSGAEPAPPDLSPSPRARIATTGRIVAILLAVLVLGAFASTRAEAASSSGGTEAAVAWLRSAQNEDGGWGESRGAESNQAMTGWAMLGLEAAGINPQDVTAAGGSPVEYLQGAISSVQSPGDLARTILALEGAGIEPREFGGRNLVAALLAKRRKDGSYEDWPNSSAYAVLALRSAGIANVADTLEWLREAQNEDGGWGDIAGSPSNADGTGAVLQVFSPSSQASKKAVGYLRQVQQKGGGFRLGGNGALNTQSTALAIQGLLAAGADPAEFKRGGKSAYEYLEDNQAGDGHYRYSSKSDQTPVWVTGQVLVAASKKYLPLEAAPRVPKPKVPKSTPTPIPTPTPETEPLPLPLPEEGGVTPAPNPAPVFPESSAGGTEAHHGGKGKGKNSGTGGLVKTPNGALPSEATEVPEVGVGEGIPESTSPVEPPTGESTATGVPAGESGSGSGSNGSVLGSIISGLVVGGILFAIGYGPYRRWKDTRAKRNRPPSAGGPGTPTGPPIPGGPATPGAAAAGGMGAPAAATTPATLGGPATPAAPTAYGAPADSDGAQPPAWTSPPYPPTPPPVPQPRAAARPPVPMPPPVAAPPPASAPPVGAPSAVAPPDPSAINGASRWPINGPAAHPQGTQPPQSP